MSCPRCRQRVPRSCIDCGDYLPFGWPAGQCSDCRETCGALEVDRDYTPAESLEEALLLVAEHPENTAVKHYLDLCQRNARVANSLGELTYEYEEAG